MALLEKDSINNIYREYFDIMQISEEQKKERIELAELLDDVFLFLFAYYEAEVSLGSFSRDAMVTVGVRRYSEALEDYGISFSKYPDVKEYVNTITEDLVDSTIKDCEQRKNANQNKNQDSKDKNTISQDGNQESYSRIEERVLSVAENEANSIFNRIEYDDAVAKGVTHKTWLTEMDNRVRPTHRAVELKSIPIDEPFKVGDSLMMFPKDLSLGASPKEVIGCRCSLTYQDAKKINSYLPDKDKTEE